MSDQFRDDEDALGGSGTPTDAQILAVRDYLRSRNRNASTRKVHKELIVRGFSIGESTVIRKLGVVDGKAWAIKKYPPKVKKSLTVEADRRLTDRRSNNATKPPKEKPVALTLADVALDDETTIAKIADLVKAANSSTHLAVEENRARMALNIIIAQRMAATPGLLMLDMRGTAALVDALTVAAKLSGGASIDIRVPVPGMNGALNGNGNGHGMIDVTPAKSPLSEDLDAFRRKRAAENAKRV
jgi:hypothetical protein